MVWATFTVVSAVLVALDVLLKVWSEGWAQEWVQEGFQGRPQRVVIPGVLGLTYHENPGAAFGLLAGAAWGRTLLTVVVILLLGAMLWYYWRMPLERRSWFIRVPLIFVFAGGLGNLIDRVAIGVVRDMLEFLFINFAIFNLADVFVTGGIFAILFFSLVIYRDFPYL